MKIETGWEIAAKDSVRSQEYILVDTAPDFLEMYDHPADDTHLLSIIRKEKGGE